MKQVMMLILTILFACVSTFLFSSILTVDNNIPSIGQYSTLQAAHDAASSGDILQVMPSNTPYQGIVVSKTLKIIGVGWQPEGYDGITIKNTTINGTMEFTTDAANSKLEGFGGEFGIDINCSSLVCKKNQLGKAIIRDQCTNLLFSQNLITSYESIPIYNFELSSFYFSNNIIVSLSNIYGSGSAFLNINGNTVITNNLICKKGNLYLEIGVNFNGNPSLSGNIFCSGTQQAAYYLNSNIIGNSSIYDVDTYHLIPGSPAIDAGNPNTAYNDLDGTRNDIGAYGGPTPFVDGGITGLPTITEFQGPMTVTPREDLQLQIKAKTNRD